MATQTWEKREIREWESKGEKEKKKKRTKRDGKLNTSYFATLTSSSSETKRRFKARVSLVLTSLTQKIQANPLGKEMRNKDKREPITQPTLRNKKATSFSDLLYNLDPCVSNCNSLGPLEPPLEPLEPCACNIVLISNELEHL